MKKVLDINIRSIAVVVLLALSPVPFLQSIAAEGDEGVPVAARTALADGFYDQAEQSLAVWLKGREEPKDGIIEGLNLYCRALAGLGRTGDIRKVARSGAPSALNVDGSVFSRYWSAYCDYQDGNLQSVTNRLNLLEPGELDRKWLAGNELRLQGWALKKLGNTNAAVNCFIEYEVRHADKAGRAGNLLDLGHTFIETGDYVRALEYLMILDQMKVNVPERVQGRHLLGRAWLESGDFSKACAVFEGLAADESAADDVRAEAWFEAAQIHAVTGSLALAVSASAQGLQFARDDRLRMRGVVLHGRALMDSGRQDEGIAVLKGQIVKMLDPVQSAQLQLEISRELLKAGRNAEAVGEFQFYLETFTNAAGLADAHMGKGWGYFRLDRFAEAAGEFSRAFTLSTVPVQREESLYKMADSYFANGQFNLALEVYERFSNEFKGSDLLHRIEFQKAESLFGAGRIPDAELQYGRLIQALPDSELSAEAHLKLSRIKLERGDAGGAIAGFEAVMSSFAETRFYVRALYGRANASFTAGEYAKALSDFEKIVKDYQSSSLAEDSMYEIGLCYLRMGKVDKVQEAFNALLKQYPSSVWAPDVVFWQGEQELNRGSFEKAEGIFISFTEKYPDSLMVPEALLRAGMSAVGRKEYVHAMDIFSRLAKQHPNSTRIPDARFAQANALAELGRFSEAILPLDEIINRYPDHVLVIPAWGRKGDFHFVLASEDKRRYEESIQCYRVVAASSKSGKGMVLQAEYKIGRSLEKLGRVQEALDRYYSRVMIPFLEMKEKGEKIDEAGRVWFTRASLGAADILEAQTDWRRAANVLERLSGSGVPAAAAAGERARKIRSENWWLFY